MISRNKIIDNLELKLEYSRRYGRLLDEQFSAINRGDSDNLARNINLMDEYDAKLRDIDRQLRKEGFEDSSESFLGNLPPESDPGIIDMYVQTRDISKKNIQKIARNREVVESRREEIFTELKDLSNTALAKHYFNKAGPGEFLNFSG